MPSLPLAAPSLQRRLHLGDTGDAHAADLRDNLSGLAGRDSWLWLAGDEGRSLHRLQGDDERGYGDPIRVKLADFGLAGGKDDGESDLEGLALDGDRLWLVGSHSLRRRRHDSDKGEPLALDPQRSANGQVLGCLHLDGRGFPRSGQRLRCHTTNSEDALTAALAANALIRPFLAIPSKDNGLDLEGISTRNNRVLLGLRGPVLRGIALVADLQLDGFAKGGDSDHTLPLQLQSLQLRYLDLGGLGVRDLAAVPDSNDVLILAGPTMPLAGPCRLIRWHDAFSAHPAHHPESMALECTTTLLLLRSGDPGDNHDKPEGLHLQHTDGELIAWIAYDSPSKHRRQGDGVCTHLDGFVVPGVG